MLLRVKGFLRLFDFMSESGLPKATSQAMESA